MSNSKPASDEIMKAIKRQKDSLDDLGSDETIKVSKKELRDILKNLLDDDTGNADTTEGTEEESISEADTDNDDDDTADVEDEDSEDNENGDDNDEEEEDEDEDDDDCRLVGRGLGVIVGGIGGLIAGIILGTALFDD